jgi:hypothetical protein
MLGKLFGKKPKYFLELKEDDQKAPAVVAPEPVVEAVATEAPAPVEKPAQAEAKAKKTSIKKSKAKTEKVATVEVAPAVSVAPTVVSNGKAESQEVEFATKYLIVPSMARRKPGPSLNPYKDMARQAKLPIK